MSTTPQVGDRVRVSYEGVVVDNRNAHPRGLVIDCGPDVRRFTATHGRYQSLEVIEKRRPKGVEWIGLRVTVENDGAVTQTVGSPPFKLLHGEYLLVHPSPASYNVRPIDRVAPILVDGQWVYDENIRREARL